MSFVVLSSGAPAIIFDPTEGSPQIFEIPPGRLTNLGWRVPWKQPEDGLRVVGFVDGDRDKISLWRHVFAVASRDGGRTWSRGSEFYAPVMVASSEPPSLQGDEIEIVYEVGTTMRDHRERTPFERVGVVPRAVMWTSAGRYSFRSSDLGKTWTSEFEEWQ